MKIIRAGHNDTDIFSIEELSHGACCFFTENRAGRYFFKINGREATLFSNTNEYVSQAIDEFLYYSGFVLTIKDANGSVLLARKQDEPYMCAIASIQPSQFFINEAKLENCKKWMRGACDVFIPIAMRDGKPISLDGHTRMKAALDLGYTSVYVYPDEHDNVIFDFADEAIKRGVRSVSDMEVISDAQYKIKWDKFCNDFFASRE